MRRGDGYWRSLLDHVEALPEGDGDPAANQPSRTDVQERDRDSAESRRWQEARQAMAEDELFELTATGFNRGGLLVSWRGLGGFVPASQLSNLPKFHVASERMHELRRRVGERLRVKIIEVDPANNRLIFSERATTSDAPTRERLWHALRVGARRHGVVTNMADFGAFVDLGGVEGLIHISELSWSRINHPTDVVRPGQIIEVKIIAVDRDNERIALSLKQMRDDPWKEIGRRYHAGQVVEGVVSNIMPYGAFVTLEDQLEGLIHISEMGTGVTQPHLVLQKGQHVVVRVLTVDEQQRRLALSLLTTQPPGG